VHGVALATDPLDLRDRVEAPGLGHEVAVLAVGELGELVLGVRRGRTSRDQITLFRSLGLAIEDLAAAEFVVGRARRPG
jgi:ornithine cyclodeaminase